MRWRLQIVLLTLAGTVARGQQPPAFEVASIKPADSAANGTSRQTSRGQVRMDNLSLKDYIEEAFNVKDFSLSAPSWLDSARFDIVAKPPGGSTREQFGAMLQTLLVERFKLACHRETKVMPAYALVLDKRGLRVKPVEGTGSSGWSMGPGTVEGKHLNMAGFADLLSERLDHPVKDMTGVSGVYDIKLTYVPDDATSDQHALPSSIFSALQEQAGLRLEPQKLPIEILVVDHIERQPTEN